MYYCCAKQMGRPFDITAPWNAGRGVAAGQVGIRRIDPAEVMKCKR